MRRWNCVCMGAPLRPCRGVEYSLTVDRLSPVVTAICRSLTPRACLNLRTSRTFRIGALSAGIGPPLAWPQRRCRPRFDRRHRELQAGLTRVAGFDRNGWPTSVGIGGRIASESVAALRRITQAQAHRAGATRGATAREGSCQERQLASTQAGKRRSDMTAVPSFPPAPGDLPRAPPRLPCGHSAARAGPSY